MLIFVDFSCNSLVKSHHGSPTCLHGSSTVRLPSGPVQSGRSNPVWSGPVCYGPVRYGPVQPVRSDLVWSGDPWSIPQIGLVWSGLGGFQKIWSPISRGDWTFRNKWPAPKCCSMGYRTSIKLPQKCFHPYQAWTKFDQVWSESRPSLESV